MNKCDVIVGFNPKRAGEENYFYVRPGGDASIVVKAAVDYIEALQSSDQSPRELDEAGNE